MKSLYLTTFLALMAAPALNAENPSRENSAPAARSAGEEEKPFRDPFASEINQTNAQPKIKDPLQPVNRAFFKFNDKLYCWVLKPTSKGYSKVVPRPARNCVRRFFDNVKFPIHLVNNLLQLKLKAAGVETGRFVVNSTVGVGGLFDPAKHWKINPHPADFDQTLGFYGVGPGIYFDWPIFGPSSARGTAGLAADGALSPWGYIGPFAVAVAVPAYREVNGASLRAGEYESFKQATLDPYVAMRSAYYESRANVVEESKVIAVDATRTSANRASSTDLRISAR